MGYSGRDFINGEITRQEWYDNSDLKIPCVRCHLRMRTHGDFQAVWLHDEHDHWFSYFCWPCWEKLSIPERLTILQAKVKPEFWPVISAMVWRGEPIRED